MSKTYLVLFAAASMTVGAVAARAQQQQPDQATTGTQSSQQQLQQQQQQQPQTYGAAGANANADAAGQQQSPYADDIRRVLARVTEDAVKGKVKDVADNFTSNSQDQFSRHGRHANETGPNATGNTDQAKEEMKAADDQLKNTSKQFMDAWKAKYNHDFDIDRKAEPMVYSSNTFQILKGDLSNSGRQPQTAAGQVGATGAGLDRNASDQGKSASDQLRDAGHNTVDRLAGGTGNNNANVNEKMDNRMATVKVAESHGAPAVMLTLVNEGTFGNRWHIQPPVGLDYKTLSANLNQHLQEVVNMKDQWPQDENQAYQLVSHHMLAAIANPSGAGHAAGEQNPNAAQPAGYQSGQQGGNQSQQPQQNQQPGSLSR